MTRSSYLASSLAALLVIFLGAYALYFYREEARELVVATLARPCSSPILYDIGEIDPRFALTKAQVEERVAASAALWNQAYGKALFAYAPGNSKAMPIHFVYDRRQQTLVVSSSIDEVEESQKEVRLQIEAARAAYTSAGNAYGRAVEKLNADSKAYSQKVAKVNASGGASPSEYQALQAEKAALETRQKELEQQGDALESQARALEAQIKDYNAKVSDINKIVQDFNATTGGEFEEGQYVQDAQGSRIYIFAYKSQDELMHTLAHEFGHALGIGHVSDPGSIMFAYNKSGTVLSEDDLAALRAVCNK